MKVDAGILSQRCYVYASYPDHSYGIEESLKQFFAYEVNQ